MKIKKIIIIIFKLPIFALGGAIMISTHINCLREISNYKYFFALKNFFFKLYIVWFNY